MSKLNQIHVNIPNWLCALDVDNPVIAHVIEAVKKATKNVKALGDAVAEKTFATSPYFTALQSTGTDAERGIMTLEAVPHENLFFRVMTELTGSHIATQGDMLGYVSQVASKRNDYEKLHEAMTQMEKTGYGVVAPSWGSFELERPQLYRSGKNFGVRLRASGKSIHLVRVDVNCEVAPIIGEQNQSEEMLKFLQSEYETNKQTVWETPIFGKSLESIVREDIEQKSHSMPLMAKSKMQKTLGRIINNGKGGVICILL